MLKTRLFLLAAALCLCWSCATVGPPTTPKTDTEYFQKAMDFYNRKNYFDAIPAFEAVREKFPLSPFAVLAELRLGDCHFKKDEFTEATHYYENFRRLHPSNPHVPYSIFMTGMCHFSEILSLDRDQTAAREAAAQFQLLIDLFPTSPYAGEALCKLTQTEARIAEHEFFIGNFYFRKGNYAGAVDRYSKTLKQYPNAVDQDKMLFYLGEALIQSGNSARGCKILQLLIDRYPDGEYTAEAAALRELHSPAAAPLKDEAQDATPADRQE